MSTLVDLIALYEEEGLSVRTGLNPLHFPGSDPVELPFTYLFYGARNMCSGGGIAIDELTFLETLFEDFKPANIFVIGNAYGWTTLALALLNRDARVVAIDLCPRREEEIGIETTNRIAEKAGLNLTAIKAKSPDDVARVAAEELTGAIDFAFIDGGHTNAQQTKDFEALREVASPDAVYLFHDVVNFAMTQSLVAIAQSNPDLIVRILMRTTSGMGIGYPLSREPEVGRAVAAFCEDEERMRDIRTAIANKRAKESPPVSGSAGEGR